MLVLIIGVISFVYMVYLWFESKTSLLNLIPQPSTLPIIHHTHHFLLEKDHIDLLERWGRQFNSKGIFRIKTLLSRYIYKYCYSDLYAVNIFCQSVLILILSGG